MEGTAASDGQPRQRASAFVDARHAAIATSSGAVEDLVRHATGSAARSSTRIVRGYDNEVYRARTQAGDDVVVRIRHFGDEPGGDYATELWAMDLARAAGVPVPAVLAVDRVESGGTSRPAMVTEAVPGLPLADAGLQPSRRRQALAEAGAALATLHAVEVGGFWHPAPDGTWPITDWRRLMDGFVADRAAERPILRRCGFSAGEVDAMVALLEEYAGAHPCHQPVLCHGDFTPDHVFVDHRGHLTGVIDFGMAHGGPALGDLAYVRFAVPDMLADLLRGYGDVDPSDLDLCRLLDLHALGLGMGHLAHEVTIGDHDQATVSTASVREFLRRLRR